MTEKRSYLRALVQWIRRLSRGHGAMQTADAVRDLLKLKGASGAHYLECNDGRTYAVKFFQQTSDKAVTNEFLGSTLAVELSLPTTNMILVRLSQEFIELAADLRSRNIRAGVHVGNERVANAFDFDEPIAKNLPEGTAIVNAADLPGIIVFDNWLLNGDRNNVGNNLLQSVGSNSFKYVMVDFGHCFEGPSWTAASLVQAQSNSNIVPLFPFIAKEVVNHQSLEPFLSRLSAIGNQRIDEIVDSIPSEWGITAPESGALKDFLKYRRDAIRGVLYDPVRRNNFPNWR